MHLSILRLWASRGFPTAAFALGAFIEVANTNPQAGVKIIRVRILISLGS